MAQPEVDFILSSIASNYGSPLADVPLQRIDRDNARNIDTDERLMADRDYQANFVGARTATTDALAIGTEYDHSVQAVVNVRLSGTHLEQQGKIDPSGSNGAVWQDMKANVRDAILQEREFPSVSNRPNTQYTWIDERNEQDLSSEFKDKYRFSVDYAFIGFEELP